MVKGEKSLRSNNAFRGKVLLQEGGQKQKIVVTFTFYVFVVYSGGGWKGRGQKSEVDVVCVLAW